MSDTCAFGWVNTMFGCVGVLVELRRKVGRVERKVKV